MFDARLTFIAAAVRNPSVSPSGWRGEAAGRLLAPRVREMPAAELAKRAGKGGHQHSSLFFPPFTQPERALRALHRVWGRWRGRGVRYQRTASPASPHEQQPGRSTAHRSPHKLDDLLVRRDERALSVHQGGGAGLGRPRGRRLTLADRAAAAHSASQPRWIRPGTLVRNRGSRVVVGTS